MQQREAIVAYNGYDYIIKDTRSSTHRYRCSVYRATNCKATLSIGCEHGNIKEGPSQHTCRPSEEPPDLVDVREKMHQLAVSMAVEQRGLSPRQIWLEINKTIDNEYAYSGVFVRKETRARVRNLIETARREVYTTDIVTATHTPEYAAISTSDLGKFLKANLFYELSSDKCNTFTRYHRILMWAHPELLVILRCRNVAVMIDGTFWCVPKPFKQCVILMALDDETDMFLPIAFALLDSKDSWAYRYMLHLVIIATEARFRQARLHLISRQL